MLRGPSLLKLCGAALFATYSPAARADEPAWLTWQAPPECPPGEHIARTLEGWLGRPFGAEEARVTAAVSASVAGWDVNVVVAQHELRGERTLRTRTCIEAADFVALSVALAVDPALEASLPAPSASNEQEQHNAPPSQPTDAQKPKESNASEPTSEAAPANEAAPQDALPAERARRAPEPPANVSWHLQAGASFDAFSLPSARLGGAAELGVSIERLNISGGARWLPPVTESVPNARSDVAFSRLTGQLRVGHLSTLGPFELLPYVEGQLGQLFAEAIEADYQARTLWAALGAGAQASWPAKSRLQIAAAFGALFPLTRSTFELSGGTKVHTVPPVTFEADLGLRLKF
jgi:hypothetical protein